MPELRERRLTTNPVDNPVTSALISPDGKYLAYSDLAGIHLKLIATGETRTIPQTDGFDVTCWLPDGSKLLANGPKVEDPGVWVISAMGGTPRKLTDHGTEGIVSPDGLHIAFMDRLFRQTWLDGSKEIWQMGPSGEEPRQVLTAKEGEGFLSLAWSPDSSRIAFLRVSIMAAGVNLESFDLKTRKVTALLSDLQLPGSQMQHIHRREFCWSPDGRIFFPRGEPAPNASDSNLWELRVNAKTGGPKGKQAKITHGSGSQVSSVNVSSDGRHLAVLRHGSQMAVYIGQLEAHGTRMKNLRSLTLDESNNVAGPWMPDNRTEVFSSNRNGNWDVFKQAIDQRSDEPLITGPDDKFLRGVTPDGRWLLYTVEKAGDYVAPVKFMRAPISGGTPEFLLDLGPDLIAIVCAKHPPSTLCTVAWRNQTGFTFSTFDPSTRRSREFSKVENAADWDLFYDGSGIAVLIKDGAKSRVRTVRSSGETEREFLVEQPGIGSIYCSSDGNALYLGALKAGLYTIYYTDLRGNLGVLWQEKNATISPIHPSPDGRYLAMSIHKTSAHDAWLLENF